MLTIEGALRHLGYDEVDPTTRQNVEGEFESAKSYLQGTVGEDVFDLLPDHPTVDSLLKAYLDEMHDERGTTSAKAGNAKREMVHSQEWHLRLALARLREKQTEEASV